MPTQILMPALSPTMTEGKLAKWLKKEGDAVKAGDVLAEIETDKATMEVEAIDEGKIKLLVPEGTENVAVNTPIAVLLGEGESAASVKMPPAAAKPAPVPQQGTATPAAPAPAPSAAASKPAPVPQQTPPVTAAPALAQAAQPAPSPLPAKPNGQGRIFASPLARRLAREAGIEISALRGSGPHGRIVRADIEAAQKGGVALAAPGAPAARPPAPIVDVPGQAPYVEEPISSMRKVIAQRLTESKQKQPHYYLSIDCEIDALLKARETLNAMAPETVKGTPDYKLSVNDFVIKALAVALRRVPAANASWHDTAIRLYQRADISVAVALPAGLITPVIRGADAKGLAQISSEMKELAARARAGKLKPHEFQGGTFSLSNLGMYGIREFSAVINPPEGGILAVGAGEQRAVVKNGALAIATVMTCTLSGDHRVVDGAVGAELLAVFRKLIETPAAMLL
ncbi:MAG TPA: pyruvate dehydrogenase complex dihydrolipoamide acetyltransferase [Alphaproteobacteria bacterium]|nr:pyruvate dehydrogenase complex dihydrolipoamide acetyltransferase [Alphaproteobacteria bacterium]